MNRVLFGLACILFLCCIGMANPSAKPPRDLPEAEYSKAIYLISEKEFSQAWTILEDLEKQLAVKTDSRSHALLRSVRPRLDLLDLRQQTQPPPPPPPPPPPVVVLEEIQAQYRQACNHLKSGDATGAKSTLQTIWDQIHDLDKSGFLAIKAAVLRGLVGLILRDAGRQFIAGNFDTMEQAFLEYEKITGEPYYTGRKLFTIQLPKIELDNLELTRVLSYLSQASMAFDFDMDESVRKGVGFVPGHNPSKFDPRLTLDMKDAKLSDILTRISNQTGAYIRFSSRDVSVSQWGSQSISSFVDRYAFASDQLIQHLKARIPEVNFDSIPLSEALGHLVGASKRIGNNPDGLQIIQDFAPNHVDPIFPLTLRNTSFKITLELITTMIGYKLTIEGDQIRISPN